MYQIFVNGNQPSFFEKQYATHRVRAVRSFPADSAKAITAFGFTSPAATGVIDEAAHTIAVTVPFGTTISALVPMIFITGASVSPASGAAHDFSSPVTYTVTAADASTQEYTVTVTVAAPVIGQSYGGGKVAYVLESVDPGYDENVWHGLIAATADQTPANSGIIWALPAFQATLVPGGTGTEIGTGSANTTKIIAQNDVGVTYAAGLARAYTGGGYSDWYLPSKDELDKLYLNRDAIGGFRPPFYQSSSEHPADFTNRYWGQYFLVPGAGGQADSFKWNTYNVRAVRSF